MGRLKTIKNININNKRVLMRVDFNEKWRIELVIPTLRYLIRKKAKIILISHLGRPNGEIKKNLSLESTAKELGKLLKKKILFSKNRIREMKFGDIVMLENIRFYPEEEKNSSKLAKELAKLGDVFVNEAFAASHRKHASIVGIPKYLPAVAGFLFQKEVEELNKVFLSYNHPLVAIIGGVKIITKLKIIKKFLQKADKLLLGGALINTIFAAKGMETGKSFIEKDMFKVVQGLNLENPKFVFPVDFVCRNFGASIKTINAVKENEMIFDIGSKSIELFLESMKNAKMIIWNGPLGLIEKKPFDRASKIIAKAIAESSAYSIVGGGDTVAFVKKLGLGKKFNYVSTGGGAMLEYLANETLPGIEALNK